MRGEINVREVMERADRLKAWRSRQARDAEWMALKQWWSADRQVRRAKSVTARLEALALRRRTAWLYRAELARAWSKWHRAKAEKWVRRDGLVID